MSLPRRSFLGWLGALPLAALATPAHGEEVVIPAGGGTGAPAPEPGKWDVSWVERLNGTKAVFDSPKVSEGSGLWRACAWRDQYHEVYGADAAVTPVLVLRHVGVVLALDDALWERFDIGKRVKLKDGRHWAKSNPSLHDASAKPGAPQVTIADFIQRGGLVLACNVAFTGMVVSRFRRDDKLDAQTAEQRAREHLVPGVILQPSGIFAALRAQQAGASYVLASDG